MKDAKAAIGDLKRGEHPPNGQPGAAPAMPVVRHRSRHRRLRVPDRPQPDGACDALTRTCEFSGGLPVHLVDEDVYRDRPSLVIGTVDKFATMAWRAGCRQPVLARRSPLRHRT